MTAGLFLGVLFLLSLSLWVVLRLRQENLLKSQVIEATNCGVIVTDATFPHHPVSYVNRAFLSLTGYAEQEVLGQTSTMLCGPHTDRASIEKLGLALQDGWACRVCVRHYRKDGTEFWNEVTLSPVKDRDGRLTSVIWSMKDISHAHELETELRKMPDPILLCDRISEGMLVVTDTEVVYVNKAGLDMLGAASDEHVVGEDFLSMIHHDLRESVRQRFVWTQPSPESEYRIETKLLRLDEQTVVVQMSMSPIVWEGRESILVCFSGLLHSRHKGDPVFPDHHYLRTTDTDSWIWDAGRGTEPWSAEQYRILGYDPGSVPPTYDTFKKALHPDDRDRVLTLIEDTFNSDRPYDIDCRVIQPCGDVRFVRCRGLLMRGLPGQPIRMSGTMEDITDYKLMTALAEERVLQFKAALEATPAGMVLVARDGSIALANGKIEHMFGYAREELIGRPVDCLFSTQDRSLYPRGSVKFIPDPASRLSKTGVESKGLRKDGSEFPAEVGFHPISLSAGSSVLLTIEDITPRREAETARRESQTCLDLAVQSGQVGIFAYDHKEDTFVWSPMFRKIHGIGMDETASLRRYLELVHPADQDALHVIGQSVQNPEEDRVCEAEYRIVRPDAAVRNINLRAVSWFDREGLLSQPIRTIGVIIDITDRKNILTCGSDASRKDSVEKISRSLVHEINNSLTAVLGFSELAVPLIPPNNKALRHLHQVIAAGRKARELAQSIQQALNHSTPSEPLTPPIEVSDAVGPRR